MNQAEKFTNENFSERFADLIRESPLSQKQLAQELGLAESAVVNYKKGRTPKAEELLRIARHFDVTMEWLLTGKDSSGAQLWSEAYDSIDDEKLEALMISVPGPDIQKAVDMTRQSIKELREKAAIHGKFAENLLIDAERLEDHLNAFIASSNAMASRAGKAAKAYDRRHP